jgi:hypothetical protein
MKKMLFCLLCIVGVYACVTECRPPKKSANLKPLDCKNYNDVRVVYYNYVQFCKDYPPYNPGLLSSNLYNFFEILNFAKKTL